MPLLSYVGPEFIYPFVVAVLVVLLIGGGLRSAFRDDGGSREDKPRPGASRYLGIVLGVALIISGTLIVLIGLWAWGYHGYQEDAGTGTANTLLFGLLMFGGGITVIAGGAAIVRAARRPPKPNLRRRRRASAALTPLLVGTAAVVAALAATIAVTLGGPDIAVAGYALAVAGLVIAATQILRSP